MSHALNALIGVVLLALFLGGFALFWIARQDDSRFGRLLGLLAMASAVAFLGYLTYGHHWL
jgi:hypothetical protein